MKVKNARPLTFWRLKQRIHLKLVMDALCVQMDMLHVISLWPIRSRLTFSSLQAPSSEQHLYANSPLGLDLIYPQLFIMDSKASLPQLISLPVQAFPGLPIPKPYVIQVPRTATIGDALRDFLDRFPNQENVESIRKTIIARTSGLRRLDWDSREPITSLLSKPSDDLASIRLTVPLLGGKGGFGSQLRAAGGRMSSRKKKNQGEQNGSSRNLDGRRLRTITEAKALAQYLTVKPEMDKQEKEERRRRWEQVVETAERKQDEIKRGGKTRLDGLWMEAKDDATEKTKDAILAAMAAGEIDSLLLPNSDSEASDDGSDDSDSDPAPTELPKTEENAKESKTTSRSFFGWDEEEESDSDDEIEQGKR
jgi:hypothetical protein